MSGRKKGDEVIEVEAEVVEDGGLAVSITPATIETNLVQLDARVSKMVAGYAEATYDLADPASLRQARRDRTYLNGIAKEIDERRRALKREYMRPFDEFEGRVNAIAEKARSASAGIKAQLDEAEDARKGRLRDELREHYEGFAGLLAPVVPYERIHEAQWLNKTFGEEKAKRAIEEKVTRVAHDWDVLKAQAGMPCYEVAEREFFASLDLGQALRAAREAQEAQDRIREMREAVEPEPEPEKEPVSSPGPQPAPEPAPPAPAAPQAEQAVPGGPYMPCVMVIEAASVNQMQRIGAFCGSLRPRVVGRFLSGTLEQAYMKAKEKEEAGDE